MSTDIKKELKKKATGGFPPLYICKKEIKDDNQIRAFSQDEKKTIASIKDIMTERHTELKPFIEL
jgi:hypothetical protein